jgi:hypothetical protein
MPKRKRNNRNNEVDNEVETVTFSMPENNSPQASLTTGTIHTSQAPTLPEQVISVSEWTVETNRVSTSNNLFSSTAEPAPSTSFGESNDDLHIPGAYHNYDVVDVSDFQPPPEPLQSFESNNTESSKVRLFVSFFIT